MKSNETCGFIPIHEGEYSGGAGAAESANVTVGRRGAEYRAECYIEGIRDRIAARGSNPTEALDALAAIDHGWSAKRATGLRRAIAEARDGLADIALPTFDVR